MSELNPFEGLAEISATKEGKTSKKSKKQAPTKEEKELVTNITEAVKVSTQNSAAGNHQEKAKLIYAIQSYGKNKRFGTYLRQQCNHRYDDGYLKKLSRRSETRAGEARS